MDDEKFFSNVDFVMGQLVNRKLQEPPQFEFCGKPREPVPAVDPEDLKSVWQIGKDAAAHGAKAVGDVIFKQACKPRADVKATFYRATLVWFMTQIAPQLLVRFTRDGQPDDAVFRAAAKFPAEWMGVGIVREGPPYDVNEFLRLCEEELETH